MNPYAIAESVNRTFNYLTALYTFCAVMCLATLYGCGVTTPAIKHFKASPHVYHFTVKDASGNPLPGASISATMFDQTSRVGDTVVTAGPDGRIDIAMAASADTTDEYQNAFDTRCEYTVSESGYLPEFGTLQIRYVLTDLNQRGDRGLNESSASVTLNRPDNLAGPTISANPDETLKSAAIEILRKIHSEFAVKGMVLPAHAASLSATGSSLRLKILIDTKQVLNTDVLTEEKMAQALFELCGRRAFETVRDNLDQLGALTGVDVAILAKKRSFNDSGADAKPVEGNYSIDTAVFSKVDSEAPDAKFLQLVGVVFNGVPYHAGK